MKGLDERVAVVTGAATGIGRGIARVLAAEGARVVIADIDGAAAEATAAELTAQGGDVLAVAADVTDRAAVDAMAAAALETYGRIDILAANAGVYRWDRIAEITDEVRGPDHRHELKGAPFDPRPSCRAMRSQAYGRIVLDARRSPARRSSAPGLRTPGLDEAAMIGLMRSAALETVTDGITVNAVQPGNVRTAGLAHIDPAARRGRALDSPRPARGARGGRMGRAVLRLGGGRVRHRTIARDRRRPGPAGSRRLISVRLGLDTRATSR